MRTILGIFFISLITSCATIFKGSRENVSFLSETKSVSVYINGRYMANTPFYTKLRSNRNYEVVMVHENGEKQVYPIQRNFKGKYLAFDIVCASTFYLFPVIIIDAVTGAWFKLDNNVILYQSKSGSNSSQY